MMVTITRGMPTPWGEAQTIEECAPGVYSVTTAAHGGILIGKRRAKKLLSERAIKIGIPWRRYLAYEEDCDVAAVFYEHPEYGTWTDAKEMKEEAEQNLRRWYPEYFKNE
jgi:hypothetical protein